MNLQEWILQILGNGGTLISEDTQLSSWLDRIPNAACLPTDVIDQLPEQQSGIRGRVIVDTGSYTDKDRLICHLARLRDLSGQPVYAYGPADATPINPQEWIALGYCGSKERPVGHHVYYFSLHDYKKTPDWLNSRHWAHPERWNKFRW